MKLTATELNKELLSDSIYRVIRRRILEGQYSPGEHIVELDIARAFDTSQAPVREAFRQLQREGIIVSIPYKGNFVSKVSDDEVREIYHLRYLIEKVVVEEMLSRWNESYSQDLRAIVEDMESAAQNNRLADLVEADLAFHGYLCRNASDYKNMINIWEILVGKSSLAIAKFNKQLAEEGNIDAAVTDHRDMVEAFDASNSEKLMQVFEKHWSIAFDNVGRFDRVGLEEYPAP